MQSPNGRSADSSSATRLGGGLFLLSLTAMGGALGCRPAAAPEAESLRPVTAVVLEEDDPRRQMRVTGTVAAWAQEDIGFDVAGRLEFVAQEGTLLEGRWVERSANGEVRATAGEAEERTAMGRQVLVPGEVLARLDNESYAAAFAAAEANVEVARVNLEEVAPAQLAAAEAQRNSAAETEGRMKNLMARGAISKEEYQRAEADLKVAQAGEQQARATISAAAAELTRAVSHLDDTRLNLERTVLYAPFTGIVSDVYVQAGGFVNPGRAVANMVMMDPINVEVRVSAETARRIAEGDAVSLFLPGSRERLPGRVNRKSTVADPSTRTFTMTVITRNRREIHPPLPEEGAGLPQVGEFIAAVRFEQREDAPLYVEERRVLQRDEEGFFVWLAEGIGDFDSPEPRPTTFPVRRVRVTPGENRRNLQGIYLARELADSGGLRAGAPLIASPPAGLKDGDRVAFVSRQWLLQPGGLIDVTFEQGKAPPGFYVPLRAIRTGGEGAYVTTIVDSSGAPAAEGVARRVRVIERESFNLRRRIEPVTEGELRPGERVIVEGAAYVVQGEGVIAVQTEGGGA